MEYLIICLTAFLGAGLTLFSGFGLGTILLPVFCLFFPIQIAIIMTALVHFSNNLFKLYLYKGFANRKVLLTFGVPALVFAVIGSYVLGLLGGLPAIFSYTLGSKTIEVTLLKLTIGILLIIFSLFDYLPKLKNIQFSSKYLAFGGVLSGFFGGLSGHQGALRSAFLVKLQLPQQSFIATGVSIACIVDIARLSTYLPQVINNQTPLNYSLILAATVAAFAGVYLGNKLLQKTTNKSLQNIVCLLLLVFGLFMAIGLV